MLMLGEDEEFHYQAFQKQLPAVLSQVQVLLTPYVYMTVQEMENAIQVKNYEFQRLILLIFSLDNFI